MNKLEFFARKRALMVKTIRYNLSLSASKARANKTLYACFLVKKCLFMVVD